MPADREAPGTTVSALVPVWNGAEFLAEAIESILVQEPRVAEVVVVDDGSTDGSGDLARSFGSRVRCVRRAHEGLAATRNAAVREARSDLVAFLDADDLWPRGRLALLLDALARNPDCGIVQGRLQRMVRDALTSQWVLVNESWRAPNVATALIRRSAFALVGPFDDKVAGADDVDWLLRAKEHGVREAQVDAVTLLYRRHGGNMTNDVGEDQARLLRVLGRAVRRRRAAATDSSTTPATRDGEQ
ncbi:glycosyltransferase family 2 protein [Candidatus Binatia bacterium]|jgi:glycosyltransferase involved in cell wall biosynthesis|nr:glycosyltransferase family 2 protein [Candidatus Binatia bacterium]